MIDFQTHPDNYKHWRLDVNGEIATLTLNVDEHGGLHEGYELKLNSYDLGVDIELADVIQRLRFEYPGVKAVVLQSAKERIFCAGANIRMLGLSSHQHKVNFCKFTNETRNSIEDASANSGQIWMCAINGIAAGGGYELALATHHILLVDDGNAGVSLPEVPLLAVLPGTGGLTRLTDKRKVRKDHADYFCTTEEGIGGQRALDWRLVDEIAPNSKFADAVQVRAKALAAKSTRPDTDEYITLETLDRSIEIDSVRYSHLEATIDRTNNAIEILLKGPQQKPAKTMAEAKSWGVKFWPFTMARELDDLILHLRANEIEIGTLVFKSTGDIENVLSYDNFLLQHQNDWFINEVILYWQRLLKRIEVSSRSLLAVIEPRSCFAGTLFEIVLCADRSYMLDGPLEDNHAEAEIALSGMNFGKLKTITDITRLASRFYAMPEKTGYLKKLGSKKLLAAEADKQELVTFIPDSIDWEDEVRLAIEERASFSPDALTGMEASLRFPGPETMESKIFGRLTAWQNWIFQRPNAVGETGALTRYGSGKKGKFDLTRV